MMMFHCWRPHCRFEETNGGGPRMGDRESMSTKQWGTLGLKPRDWMRYHTFRPTQAEEPDKIEEKMEEPELQAQDEEEKEEIEDIEKAERARRREVRRDSRAETRREAGSWRISSWQAKTLPRAISWPDNPKQRQFLRHKTNSHLVHLPLPLNSQVWSLWVLWNHRCHSFLTKEVVQCHIYSRMGIRIPSVVGGLKDFYVQHPRSREDYPKIIEIYELEYMNNIIGMAWLKLLIRILHWDRLQ